MQLRSLYSVASFMKQLHDEPKLIDFVIQNGRTSELVHWDRFSPDSSLGFLRKKFFVSEHASRSSSNIDVRMNGSVKDLGNELFIYDRETLKEFLFLNVNNPENSNSDVVDDVITSQLTELFMNGSQIHQNASTLLYLGLPIIKLDVLYRGMLNIYDIRRLSRLLPTSEAVQLQKLLLERPFGGNTLIGWKRAAFLVGLI